jgi:hypothetical protein
MIENPTSQPTVTTGNIGAAVHLLIAGYPIVRVQPMPHKVQHLSFTVHADASRHLAEYLEATKELFYRIRREQRGDGR